MHTKLRSLRLPGLSVILLAFLLSCKKDHRVLDTSVQPEGDKFSGAVVQEYNISAYTIPHEDFLSFSSGQKFLGTNVDPVFGRTEIGLYCNVNFEGVNVNLAGAVLDSARFMFVTHNSRRQGDVNAPLSFSVFPMDSTLDPKRFYFAGNDKLHNTTPLPTTKVTIPYSASEGTIVTTIPLDQAYAAGMLANTNAWASVDAFQKVYKGFYILASPAGGSGQIREVNLNDALSGLYLYYKIDDSSYVFRLAFTGDKAAKYNTVKRNYSQAVSSLQNQLAGDSTSTDFLYVQGFGGTKARIYIPVLPYVSDSFQLAISRAELILPVEDVSNMSEDYKRPDFLSLLAVSSSGKDSLVYDQRNTTDNVRYDGKYRDGKFVFNIARHMQAVVKGEVVNRGFNLVVSDPARAGTMFRDEYIERVVLGGPKSSIKPTFKLTYSKVSIR